MKTFVQNNQKILFIGDSITDCDRDINNLGPLGFGYVGLFNDLLITREPEKDIKIINKGTNGNTLGHLLSRWGDDVYEHKPDVLSILIGINDATRYFDNSASYYLAPEQFEETYSKLLNDTKKELPDTRIILIEPFFLSKGKNPQGSYWNDLKKIVAKYIKSVNNISALFKTELIPLSSQFDELITHKPSATFSEDRIHLNRAGHLFIAERVFETFCHMES